MRALRFLLVLAAGCSTDGPPEADVTLSIDVALVDGTVSLYATEPERPCDCSVGWTDLGECRTQSDAIGCACDPWPASCLDEVTVWGGGQALASTTFNVDAPGAFLVAELSRIDELAITGCGTAVVVEIPERVPPEVSIEIIDPEAAHPTVAWSTEPSAASALVGIGDWYTTDVCHRLGGAGEIEIPDQDEWSVGLTALAKPVFNATPLGDIRLWFGDSNGLASYQ